MPSVAQHVGRMSMRRVSGREASLDDQEPALKRFPGAGWRAQGRSQAFSRGPYLTYPPKSGPPRQMFATPRGRGAGRRPIMARSVKRPHWVRVLHPPFVVSIREGLGGSSSRIASLSNLDKMWRLPDGDRHVARLENLPGRRPFVDFKTIWNFRNEGRARGTWRKIVANLMEPLGSLLILGDGQPAIHFIRLYPEDLHRPTPWRTWRNSLRSLARPRETAGRKMGSKIGAETWHLGGWLPSQVQLLCSKGLKRSAASRELQRWRP